MAEAIQQGCAYGASPNFSNAVIEDIVEKNARYMESVIGDSQEDALQKIQCACGK